MDCRIVLKPRCQVFGALRRQHESSTLKGFGEEGDVKVTVSLGGLGLELFA